ncbi:TIGR03792 family protein [Calothrix sp. 336/3]|uniref:TIGR03792 family protein n=1 Tax=Calothrix sp. 336/3 TaxID=1337936 RepID=UPI0004E45670|nr:TIGR03792 family protein [Calothrix sp. 336/3]AKG20236.1 cyanobacterial protein, TIGR03792 family [Calothrix sp. 336/3]
MVIEQLKVKVPPNMREKYIQVDAEIWTTALSRYPGFLSKEVWINPNDNTEIVMVIKWETRKQWKAIPEAELAAIDAQFTKVLGTAYPLTESSEFQVRKFPSVKP